MIKRRILTTGILLATASVAVACAVGRPAEQTSSETVMETSSDVASETSSDTTTAEIVAAGSEAQTFTIVPTQSEARFIVNEVLAGAPKTVVGTTSAVEGEIVANYDQPSSVTMSAIRVDLSTLVTDNNFRTRSLHDNILETGNPAYQYAEFTMTRLDGLPDQITIGEPFDFQITGNLTIHGVTREVTFQATVTPVSETELSGIASLTITYADFGVQILRLPPQVASVEDQVILEIEFVAWAQ